jgi:glutaredoxin
MRGRFNRRRWFVAAAVLVIIGGGALTLLLSAFDRFTIEGSIRPTLEVRTVDDQLFRLVTPYGRRHVLLFFLVSCPHCKQTLEHLRRIRPSMTSCDLFAVSLSERPATANFAAIGGYPFPVWGMPPRDALLKLGIRRVPTTLFVSELDRVDLVHTGARSFSEDSVLLVRYCNGGSLGLSVVDSLGRMGHRENSAMPPSVRSDR